MPSGKFGEGEAGRVRFSGDFARHRSIHKEVPRRTMRNISLLLLGIAFVSGVAQNVPSREQRVANWLNAQDADRDGRISLDESRGQMQANFRSIDANGDDHLDNRELTALAERLSRSQPRTPRLVSDDEIRKRASQDIRLELNVAYREGHELWKLDLASPVGESARPRPAIVIVHGGGWVRGDKRTEAFVGHMLDYAAKGFVAINVNYRLDRAKRPCVEDVKCAVRWLRAHAMKYNVDPNRIGAYGNSAGAHLVAMLGLSHQEEQLEVGPWRNYSSAVQAVAGSATPTRPNVPGGTEAEKALIAPMTYVSSEAPPFLLFHEVSDRVVNVSNSDDLVAALRAAGAEDVTYERYTDGSGHGVFRANFEETGPEMARFFARTLSVK